MGRYFIEVAYKGTRYSGFQIQENANTIQYEIEKAFSVLHRKPVLLTGSSRTDAGVHALQNFFHFDFAEEVNKQFMYKMNALLPDDIVVKNLYHVSPQSHSRFDALSREYEYRIYTFKNPFFKSLAHYYPYKVDMDIMNRAAAIVRHESNFFAFAKTNTQVNNYSCSILKSQWLVQNHKIIYNIEGNRFLRGMVRLLTATMLKLGRGKITIDQFVDLLKSSKEKCGFSVPAEGLYLKSVNYPENYFKTL